MSNSKIALLEEFKLIEENFRVYISIFSRYYVLYLIYFSFFYYTYLFIYFCWSFSREEKKIM